VDEGRKRVIGIMAAILASPHMQNADDLFGGPQGSPRTDKMVAAAVRWAERIMRKIYNVFGKSERMSEASAGHLGYTGDFLSFGRVLAYPILCHPLSFRDLCGSHVRCGFLEVCVNRSQREPHIR
jgi:hypothetical protein